MKYLVFLAFKSSHCCSADLSVCPLISAYDPLLSFTYPFVIFLSLPKKFKITTYIYMHPTSILFHSCVNTIYQLKIRNTDYYRVPWHGMAWHVNPNLLTLCHPNTYTAFRSKYYMLSLNSLIFFLCFHPISLPDTLPTTTTLHFCGKKYYGHPLVCHCVMQFTRAIIKKVITITQPSYTDVMKHLHHAFLQLTANEQEQIYGT